MSTEPSNSINLTEALAGLFSFLGDTHEQEANQIQSTKASTPKTPKTTVILFGLDEQEQPRGAQFVGEDEASADPNGQGHGPTDGHARSPLTIWRSPASCQRATFTRLASKPSRRSLSIYYEKLNALVGGETGVISTVATQILGRDRAGSSRRRHGHRSAMAGGLPSSSSGIRTISSSSSRDFPGQGDLIRDVNSVALLKND